MRKSYDTTAMINALVEAHGADEEVEVIADNIDSSEVPEPIEVPQEAPASEPVQEPAKEVEQPAPAPAAEPEAKSWADDFAQLKAQVDFQNNLLRQQFSSPTPSNQQPSAPKPLREITDESEYAQRLESMEANAAMARNALKALELQNANRALFELKQEFPDIDKHIPMNEVHRAIEIRMQQGTVGADWKTPLLKVYDVVTDNARFNNQTSRIKQLEDELQKAKDELAAKRAQREAVAREVSAAGQIPATGSVYQDVAVSDVPKVGGQLRGRRAYDAAARAMTSALRKS